MRIREIAVILLGLLLMNSWLKAANIEVPQAEWEKMKADIEALRKKDAAANAIEKSPAERALVKYGPNTAATTKTGKLVIAGLLQVWYYSIQNDHKGLFQDKNVNSILDTNETQDNDSFRIRRAEVKFNMDVTENVTAVIMLDAGREATGGYPGLPGNQAHSGGFKRLAQADPTFAANANNKKNFPSLGGNSTSAVSNTQSGNGSTAPRLLQDAYINYHGVVPHHDFQAGQFIPAVGEEGTHPSFALDFVERSFIGQINNSRDLGMSVHGAWWDETAKGGGRCQYKLGLFDSAGNYFGSAGQAQNRSDDNDAKDFSFNVLVRPVWEQKTWGNLELGMSGLMGKHGESGGTDPLVAPINGLNRASTWAAKYDAWASYAPGGVVKGWWLRGEWMRIKDRNAPNTVIDLAGNGTSNKYLQGNPRPTSVQGWYMSTGYKLSQSSVCDSI